MQVPFDTLDAHLRDAGDIARASKPMGWMLAWAVQMQLLAPSVQQAHEHLVLRIRYREARGSELLVACGGDLNRELFTPAGEAFLDDYYPHYRADLEQAFGPDIYAVEDTWDSYGAISPLITRAYMSRHSQSRSIADQVARGLRKIFRKRS